MEKPVPKGIILWAVLLGRFPATGLGNERQPSQQLKVTPNIWGDDWAILVPHETQKNTVSTPRPAFWTSQELARSTAD